MSSIAIAAKAQPLRRRAKPVLLALGTAALSIIAVSAQQTPAAPPAASALEEILKRPVEPAHLAIAEDVLRASGMITMFDNAMPNVVGALRVNFSRQRPELVKDIEESLKVVEADIPKVSALGLSGAARFLAARLDQNELKEVSAFLSSPVGQKYVQTLPPFMEQVVPYLEIWSQEATGRLQRLFLEEMGKRGHKL